VPYKLLLCDPPHHDPAFGGFFMLKSIWFWLFLVVGIIVLYLAWDKIEARLPDSMMEQPTRTVNTQQLARTLTPASEPDWEGGEAGSGSISNVSTPKFATVTVAAISASGVSNVSSVPKVTSTPRTVTSVSKTVTYKVKPGDTMYSIAKRYGIDVRKLAGANGLSDPSALKAGTELKIPVTPVPTPRPVTPPPGASTYTVKPGDTLSSIARSHGTSPGELQKLNHLPNPNQIKVGMTIVVPGGSASTKTVSRTATHTTTSSGTGTGVTPTSSLLSPTSSALDSFASTPELVATPQTISATATPTPLPTKVNRCPTGEELVLVWGLSLCRPEGWTVTERGLPDRAVTLVQDSDGDRAMVTVVRPGGWPNAPASVAIRSAKNAVVAEAAAHIPGGITPPEDWTAVKSVSIAGVQGQMTETRITYQANGQPAQVRLIAFEKEGQWWHVIQIAPQGRWGYYTEAGFPPITNSLQVF